MLVGCLGVDVGDTNFAVLEVEILDALIDRLMRVSECPKLIAGCNLPSVRR